MEEWRERFAKMDPRTRGLLIGAVVAVLLGAGWMLFGSGEEPIPPAEKTVTEGIANDAATDSAASFAPELSGGGAGSEGVKVARGSAAEGREAGPGVSNPEAFEEIANAAEEEVPGEEVDVLAIPKEYQDEADKLLLFGERWKECNTPKDPDNPSLDWTCEYEVEGVEMTGAGRRQNVGAYITAEDGTKLFMSIVWMGEPCITIQGTGGHCYNT